MTIPGETSSPTFSTSAYEHELQELGLLVRGIENEDVKNCNHRSDQCYASYASSNRKFILG